MTRSDRILGSSKTAAMLRADKTIEAGMAELGRALERQIRRQDRAEQKGSNKAPRARKTRGGRDGRN